MYDYERLRKNIRCLRVAFGESQEKLADSINVSKSAMSMYETGERDIDKDILRAIAEHYGVSVEELLTDDLGEIGEVLFSINPYVFGEEIDVILPIAATKAALQNRHFGKANSIHHAVFDKFRRYVVEKKGDIDVIDDLAVCVDEYIEAYNYEESREVSAANLVCLWFWFLNFVRNGPRVVEKKPAAIMQLTKHKKKFEEEIENINSKEFDKDIKEIEDEFLSGEIREKIIEYLTVIKHSKDWTDLADYYLALQYLWNLVDNGLNPELNGRIGAEMQSTFALVGNPYSAHYFDFAQRTYGLK